MKPNFARIVAILLISIHLSTLVYAEAITDQDKEIPFPYPAGPVRISNGYQGYYTHQGDSKYALDMQVPFKGSASSCDQYGTPVIAVRGGDVVRARNAGEDGSFGTHLIIRSEKDIHIWYAHMIENSLQVSLGDKVEQGQLLGLMGDTGNTAGATCEREVVNAKGEKINKTLKGVHLHTEIREGMYGKKEKGKFIPPVALKYTALLGEKAYTDIVVGNYVSTSLLTKDQNGYWDKMKEHFLYKLPEDAVGDVSLNPYNSSSENEDEEKDEDEAYSHKPAKITHISPLYLKEDESTLFTIRGEHLSNNLTVDFPVCEGGIEWKERGSKEQQFMCTIDLPGITGGKISVPGDQKIEMSFDVRILGRDEMKGETTYHGFPEVPASAKPGDTIKLSVEGKNLPEDLIFEAPACETINYIYRSVERHTVECKLSQYSYNGDGSLKNEIISHGIKIKNGNGEIVTQGTLVVDHEIKIESITPPVAYFGQKTSFTLRGKGVDQLKIFHLDYCEDLTVLSQSSLQGEVVLQCRLPVPEKFFSPLMPDILKRKTLNLHVKDKPSGEMILAGKIEAIAFPESWVNEILPYNPRLGENTLFTIFGSHFPDRLLYWMDHCGQGEIHPSQENTTSFSCKPEPIGSNALEKIELAASKAKKNPNAFVKEIEKQRRLVEIKYPRDYSQDGKTAFTIYRGYILPLPEKYEDLYLTAIKNLKDEAPGALWVDETNKEDLIGYILNHPGDYSDAFLKKVGWKNTGSGNNPLYQLMACSGQLKKESQRYGPLPELVSQLNTTGACAKGLDIQLIEKELAKMYADKT